MTYGSEDLDKETEERLVFWSEFLNSEEGRLVVGDLNQGEMKHFHADGFIFELRLREDKTIDVKYIGKE